MLDVAFNGLTLDGPVASLAAPMFWDNRARSLEQQALGPIAEESEMRRPNYDAARIVPEVVARLSAVSAYASQFERAFGPGGVTAARIGDAIAAFERSLVATDSSFDRYMRGEAAALTAQQVRGMAVFERSGCGNCHAGPMFSDFALHALGVPDLPSAAHDPGDGRNRFRTASLRFVSRSAARRVAAVISRGWLKCACSATSSWNLRPRSTSPAREVRVRRLGAPARRPPTRRGLRAGRTARARCWC
jgi:cytochrome c peroxidase